MFHLRREPEWTYRNPTSDYNASLHLLGDHILVLRASGFAEDDDARNIFALTRKVVEECFGDGRPVVSIDDYATLRGASFKARKIYVDSHKHYDRYLCKILCNTSVLLNLSIQLAKRFNVFPFDVYQTTSLEDAIQLAKIILAKSEGGLAFDTISPLNILEYASRPEILTGPNWFIQDEEFSVQFEVIDTCILHIIAHGILQGKNVSALMEMQQQIAQTVLAEKHFKFIIVNACGLKRIERKARKYYMHAILQWYARAPFEMYIIYGANPLIQAAAHLARLFMPFKTKLTKDFRSAIALTHLNPINIVQNGTECMPREVSSIDSDEQIRIYVEELLQYLGKINWEKNGFDSSIKVDETHPFRPVFDVLQMIKEEIDELFQERKRVEGQLRQSQKMEAIGILAGGISHDFNNILTSIIGYTELALDDAGEGTPLRSNLNEVLIAADRAKNLVRQILTFSRQVEPEIKPISLKPIINEVCRLLRSSLPTTIEIRTELDSDAIIKGDATQIHQVILNLGTNAGHAMEAEGGILLIQLQDVVLDSAFVAPYKNTTPGNYLKLVVCDTGHGMRSDIIEKIFDPFFTTKDQGKGTGMGLALVHGIVTSLNGLIQVSSQESKGSRFDLYFPVVQTVSEDDLSESAPIPSGNERILLVDDEYSIVKMEKQLFESLGYHVEHRTASLEALELFRARPDSFDLIITDLTMPNMTGTLLAKEVKRIRPDIPVILCTGFAERAWEGQMERDCLAAVEEKPLSKRRIAATVRRILDRALL